MVSLEFDYVFATNMLLVTIPIVIGVIGSKLLVDSWQVRKEKFALRKEILVDFQKTYPLAESSIYGLYLKVTGEYSTIVPNAEYEDGVIPANWTYPKEESEKPFNKFRKEFQKLNEELSQIYYKINGFKGLIILYFKNSEGITTSFNELRTDVHAYHLRINRMIFAKNVNELVLNNVELIEIKNPILNKILRLEKILIESELKNPKT